MELFHKVVLGFAIVILILILVSLGLLLDEQQKSKVYPPTALNCPDYWIEEVNDQTKRTECKINTNLKTNTGRLKNEDGEIETLSYDFKDYNAEWRKDYRGLSDTCAKRKWARDNDILWDGISNYNSC